jgi:hypothetical protein
LEIIGSNHDFLHEWFHAVMPYNHPSRFKLNER